MSASIWHPIVGDGYCPIFDDDLAIELEGAEIVEQNDMFGTFTLIVGYRDRAYSADGKIAQPFICIKNHTAGQPHLFMWRG
jgi:hypothetical protein